MKFVPIDNDEGVTVEGVHLHVNTGDGESPGELVGGDRGSSAALILRVSEPADSEEVVEPRLQVVNVRGGRELVFQVRQ